MDSSTPLRRSSRKRSIEPEELASPSFSQTKIVKKKRVSNANVSSATSKSARKRNSDTPAETIPNNEEIAENSEMELETASEINEAPIETPSRRSTRKKADTIERVPSSDHSIANDSASSYDYLIPQRKDYTTTPIRPRRQTFNNITNPIPLPNALPSSRPSLPSRVSDVLPEKTVIAEIPSPQVNQTIEVIQQEIPTQQLLPQDILPQEMPPQEIPQSIPQEIPLNEILEPEITQVIEENGEILEIPSADSETSQVSESNKSVLYVFLVLGFLCLGFFGYSQTLSRYNLPPTYFIFSPLFSTNSSVLFNSQLLNQKNNKLNNHPNNENNNTLLAQLEDIRQENHDLLSNISTYEQQLEQELIVFQEFNETNNGIMNEILALKQDIEVMESNHIVENVELSLSGDKLTQESYSIENNSQTISENVSDEVITEVINEEKEIIEDILIENTQILKEIEIISSTIQQMEETISTIKQQEEETTMLLEKELDNLEIILPQIENEPENVSNEPEILEKIVEAIDNLDNQFQSEEINITMETNPVETSMNLTELTEITNKIDEIIEEVYQEEKKILSSLTIEPIFEAPIEPIEGTIEGSIEEVTLEIIDEPIEVTKISEEPIQEVVDPENTMNSEEEDDNPEDIYGLNYAIFPRGGIIVSPGKKSKVDDISTWTSSCYKVQQPKHFINPNIPSETNLFKQGVSKLSNLLGVKSCLSSPNTMISHYPINFGECYAIEPQGGRITLELFQLTQVNAIGISHFLPKSEYKLNTSSLFETSLMKTFYVTGWGDSSSKINTQTPRFELGRFTIDTVNDSPRAIINELDSGYELTYVFPLDQNQHHLPYFKSISLFIGSNHGNQDFTCIYRIKLFGNI